MADSGPDLSQCQGRARSQVGWKVHGKQGRRVMEMGGTSVLKLALREQESKCCLRLKRKVGGFGSEGAPE